jgi:hypothetical protein
MSHRTQKLTGGEARWNSAITSLIGSHWTQTSVSGNPTFEGCRILRAVGGKDMERIEEMVKELPPELQQEVEDFAVSGREAAEETSR